MERRIIDEWTVRDEAEALSLTIPWDDLDLDACVPAYETADLLGSLHLDLVVKDDIPMMLRILDVDASGAAEACKEWRAYWDGIDYQARARALLDPPFFGDTAAIELRYPTKPPRGGHRGHPAR